MLKNIEMDELELKFIKLNEKIISKRKSIKDSYKTDVIKIEKAIVINQSTKDYSNKLNLERHYLIQKLNERLRFRIDEINAIYSEYLCYLNSEFYYKDVVLSKRLNEYDLKDKFIYLNNISFDSIFLNKFKFTQPFNISKLNKYKNLLINKKEFNLMKLNESFSKENFEFGHSFIFLPSNKAFFCAKKNATTYTMFLIKTTGLVLCTKDIVIKMIDDSGVEYMDHDFKSSEFHIIRLCIKADPMWNDIFDIEIYNFNLQLVHSFNDFTMDHLHIFINKNEYAFEHIEYHSTISIYDCKSFKCNDVKLEILEDKNRNDYFYTGFSKSQLVHFNDDNLYFIKRLQGSNYELYLVDRGSKQVAKSKIHFKLEEGRGINTSLKFDENSKEIYYFYEYTIKIYKSNGEFLYKIQSNRYNEFISLFEETISFNKIIYDIHRKNNFIEYYEY